MKDSYKCTKNATGNIWTLIKVTLFTTCSWACSASPAQGRIHGELYHSENTPKSNWSTHWSQFFLVVSTTEITTTIKAKQQHAIHIRDRGSIFISMLALLILCSIHAELLVLLVNWICKEDSCLEVTRRLKREKKLNQVAGLGGREPGERAITTPPRPARRVIEAPITAGEDCGNGRETARCPVLVFGVGRKTKGHELNACHIRIWKITFYFFF